MQFWPFLIAANHASEYRAVLCPDFIESSARKELFRYIDFSPSTEGSIHFRDVNDDRLGRLLIYYRTTRVFERGTETYDAAGRPFLRYEGIVVRATSDGHTVDTAVAERAINQASSEIDKAFDSFWQAANRPPATLSKQQYLGPDVLPPEPPLPEPPPPEPSFLSEPPPIAPTKVQWMFALGLLVVSLIGNAAFFGSYYNLAGRVSTLEAGIAERTRQIATLSKNIDELRSKLEEAGK
jgi:hypothetical protein